MHAAMLAAALILGGWQPGPELEITGTALLYGVEPAVALAVHDAESGNIPEAGGTRERVVSKGNYGRFQVNCTTWKAKLGIRRCRELLDRHVNIRSGVWILSRFQGRFAKKDGHGCRCRRRARHHWTAHYNEGVLVTKDGRGVRYGEKVARKIARMRERSWIPAGLARRSAGDRDGRSLLPAAGSLLRVFTAPLAGLGLFPATPERVQASLQSTDHSGDPGTEARGS